MNDIRSEELANLKRKRTELINSFELGEPWTKEAVKELTDLNEQIQELRLKMSKED